MSGFIETGDVYQLTSVCKGCKTLVAVYLVTFAQSDEKNGEECQNKYAEILVCEEIM